MSLSDIPFETCLDAIVPLLNVEDIGALSMVNKELKEFCDDNLVWRDLYLRTIPRNITDDSVHKRDPCSLKRYHGKITGSSGELLSYVFHGCLPDEVRAKVPKINPDLVNIDPYHASTSSSEKKAILLNRQEYSETIREVWQKHNESLGLSTVNLCRCPDHYKFETLAMPTACKNSKSYKTAVLSKMNTQAKKPLPSLEKTLTRKQNEIPHIEWKLEKLQRELAKLQREEAKLNQSFVNATTKSAHLNQAVQTLKANAKKVIDDKEAAKADAKAEKEAKKKTVKKTVKKPVKKTKN
jgi:hypothetical protein